MNEQTPIFFVHIERDGSLSILDPDALTEKQWIDRAPLRQPLLRQLDRRIAACRRRQCERRRR